MKDLRAVKGRFYISRLIEQGEHEHQDFKFAISDARKIARSVSAFANNDGGRLLIGVKDNGAIAGVRNEEDIFVVEQAASMYCSPEVPIEVTAFAVGEGHVVLRVEIARAKHRPVMVKESDGSRRAYFRVKDENIAASRIMVDAWRLSDTPDCDRPPLLLTADGPESRLLEAISREPATPERLAISARISQARANDIIVNLYAMGLARFTYRDGSFLVEAAQ